MLEFLDALKKNILRKCARFSSWVQSTIEQYPSSSSSSVAPCSPLLVEVEQLVVKVLLGVQQVMGRHQEQLREYKCEEEEEEEGTRSDDTPLCKTLHDISLQNIHDLKTEEVCAHLRVIVECEMVCCSLPKVIDSLQHLLESVSASPVAPDSLHLVQLLSQALPLLCQFALLQRRFLEQLLISYRTVGKLLSILLTVFTNLFSKVRSHQQEGKEGG